MLLCAGTTIFAQTPPFHQAPAVGADTSAAVLLVIEPDGSLRVKTDPTQGPYDGDDDTLYGVQNNSNKTISSIPIKSSDQIFAFDFDGIDTVEPHPAGAPFGETGYEGPGVSFSNISSDATSGVVNFAGGIPPGGSAYFALELALSTLCPPISGVPLLKQSGRTDLLDSLPASYCRGSVCKPGTIAYFGCAITSSAMLINYVKGSVVTSPEALNTYLKGRADGYFGASVNWYAVAAYAKTLNVSLSYRGTIPRRDDFSLDSYLCSGVPVILSVLNNGHFVLATGQTTANGMETYLINDPAAYPNDATLQPFSYTYSGLRPFAIGSSRPSALYVVAHSPVELMLTDPSGNKTGLNPTGSSSEEGIPSSSYTNDAVQDDVDGSALTTPEVKILEVLTPEDGTYILHAQGIGSGAYSLDFWAYDENGAMSHASASGQASLGSSAAYTVNYSSLAGSKVSVTSASGKLGNISTRLQVGPGDDVLIAGFIVAGTAPKKILLRARGPSLSAASIAAPIPNPELELHDAANLIASNRDWQTTEIGGVITADQANAISTSGLQPDSTAEPAIIATLPPGAYTAIVKDEGSATGVGTVEAYDLESGSDSSLVNVSTRGLVRTGDNVMIGGFITIAAPTKLFIRARGPSLSSAGIASGLPDPELELHDAGNTIARNNDWQTTQLGGIITSDQVAEIQNSTVKPSSPAEPAMIVTLAPGSYTVIVSDANGHSGVATVEAFAIP